RQHIGGNKSRRLCRCPCAAGNRFTSPRFEPLHFTNRTVVEQRGEDRMVEVLQRVAPQAPPSLLAGPACTRQRQDHAVARGQVQRDLCLVLPHRVDHKAISEQLHRASSGASLRGCKIAACRMSRASSCPTSKARKYFG